MEPTTDPLAERVLETPVRLMRVVWAWPDATRSALKANVAHIILFKSIFWVTMASVVYIAWGQYDNMVTVLSSTSDIVAGFVVMCKIHYIFRNGDQLREMRSALQYSFQGVEDMLAPEEAREANRRCLDKARKFCRYMMLLYAPLAASGVGLNVANMFLSRETRQFNIKVPAFVTQTDWIYWPLFFCSMILFTSFMFMSGGFDTLFLSLCMHMRCKCEILRKLFRHANQRNAGPGEGREYEYWHHDGTDYGNAPTALSTRSSREVEAALRACAYYHQQLIKIRDTTELVFNNVTLILMAYLLLGLGIPALRMMYDTLDASAAVYLMLYTTWNFAQLLFYCWFADTVAYSVSAFTGG
ncbi:uncharacterized protein LOC117642953 [Thrips palmi]|uniref:Odorant receptor n=1 Tax=Thrips palmi TaxID=161013 RepID=A0A6P8ZKP9_THRPL|nr:uncharacterized protein LOC117642953 [Thrips palmi]